MLISNPVSSGRRLCDPGESVVGVRTRIFRRCSARWPGHSRPAARYVAPERRSGQRTSRPRELGDRAPTASLRPADPQVAGAFEGTEKPKMPPYDNRFPENAPVWPLSTPTCIVWRARKTRHSNRRDFDGSGLEDFLHQADGESPPVFVGREDILKPIEFHAETGWKGSGASVQPRNLCRHPGEAVGKPLQDFLGDGSSLTAARTISIRAPSLQPASFSFSRIASFPGATLATFGHKDDGPGCLLSLTSRRVTSRSG